MVAVCLCGFVSAATPGVWLDVPFVKQEKEGCGAASIAMVMQYWHKQQNKAAAASADAVEIQRALYSGKDHGIRSSDLERYFQEHGFRTFTFAGKWSDLKQHLVKGRPLIVALKPSALETSLHYVVVVGVDPEQDVVLLNDAAQRKLLKQERASFENQWSAVGRWTLLALPKT
jgi:ABC-type bacteriocin/lantibiotic exporter with double-glycine peptidase domain